MRQKRTLRFASVVVAFLVAFLFQETWTLAGVTGNMTGIVRDATGAPIAGVEVQAVSPSMKANATTDAGGHFVILSLAPDTYTVNLTRSGYQSVGFPGVTVFADQTQNVAYTMVKTLRTIARVTSAAGASLVKSGVGGDLYSVNSAQASAAPALGGGGNLNNAYSAMATVPGVQVLAGRHGLGFQRGLRPRSELLLYRLSSTTVFRSIARSTTTTPRPSRAWVCRSCRSIPAADRRRWPRPARPGSSTRSSRPVRSRATASELRHRHAGVLPPGQVEIGGSTPDRTFSYYIGLSGYNQDYRLLDNSNGAGYMTPGGSILR